MGSIGLTLKLLLKPALVLTTGIGSVYAYKQWDAAKSALHIKGMNQKALIELFEKIDIDKSGSISEDELKNALEKAGLKINSSNIHRMMEIADENKDGLISKEEWLHMCADDGTHSNVDKNLSKSNNNVFVPKKYDDSHDVDKNVSKSNNNNFVPKIHIDLHDKKK